MRKISKSAMRDNDPQLLSLPVQGGSKGSKGWWLDLSTKPNKCESRNFRCTVRKDSTVVPPHLDPVIPPIPLKSPPTPLTRYSTAATTMSEPAAKKMKKE